MNQEVVKVILDCKKDIWKSQELLQTLDFCTALEKCLKRSRDSQLLILVALQQFEEFFQIFQSVYKHQVLMFEKLQLRKNKLDKKLKYIKSWRKVSSMIFVATFAAVLICSVVAAAIAAPPVAAAIAAATSIPIGSMGKWMDSLWKNYENALKGQKEVISSMQAGTYVAIKDLDSIRVLIDRLEIEIESLLRNVDFAIEEGAVKVAIEEIKKKLGVQADMCSRDIRRARTVVLQRIIKHPHN
ncbi:hypothetical protein V8G54_024981 [Vigna mungo]|uniref:Uncharacterized protein n=1 Tax=Vigna mungo TaxID=3915 RepID=A0AAQ3N7B8_VIGMU